jgi:hypothetical protein
MNEIAVVATPPAVKAAKLIALMPIWSAQYLMLWPMVAFISFLGWLIKGALKVGIVGVLLLCIPFFGWIILAVMLMNHGNQRRADQRHAETMAALGHMPVLSNSVSMLSRVSKPLGLAWLKA